MEGCTRERLIKVGTRGRTWRFSGARYSSPVPPVLFHFDQIFHFDQNLNAPPLGLHMFCLLDFPASKHSTRSPILARLNPDIFSPTCCPGFACWTASFSMRNDSMVPAWTGPGSE